MLNNEILQTIAEALKAYHDFGKEIGIEDERSARDIQDRVLDAWKALGLPGAGPWEF